jgi:hypothetical protein
MPPTIIVTVGRVELEPEAEPELAPDAPPAVVAADVLLLPDEQAATLRTVAQAAASAAKEPLLMPTLRIMLLLCFVTSEKKFDESGDRRPVAVRAPEQDGEIEAGQPL